MNTFIAVTPLVTGLLLILSPLMIHTKNWQSALIFKVLPFSMGICSAFSGAKLLGWI